MSAPLTIPTIFTADAHGFSNGVKMMQHNIRSFSSEVSRQFISIAGTAAIAAGAFSLGNFTKDSIMEYETAVQSLQAVTMVSDQAMSGFKEEINDLAHDAKKSAI